ncbi:hypothetical protein GWD52_02460 [Enterobacteriaceae bacterium 4M9]|nr:hypothetical protein [Enterobacteriaceae bacterium 4M9]
MRKRCGQSVVGTLGGVMLTVACATPRLENANRSAFRPGVGMFISRTISLSASSAAKFTITCAALRLENANRTAFRPGVGDVYQQGNPT